MKAVKVFIRNNKSGQIKQFPVDSFKKHKAALLREGWREATMTEIKAAGYELQEVKKEKPKKQPKVDIFELPDIETESQEI